MKFSYDEHGGNYQLTFALPRFPECLIHTIFEWQWVGMNWIDFHPILLHIERDYILKGWEWSIVILGLGLRFRLNSQEALDKMEEWGRDFDLDRFKDIEQKGE